MLDKWNYSIHHINETNKIPMNYEKKYKNLIRRFETLLNSYELFSQWTNIEENLVANDIKKSIEKILTEERENEMPSGAEIVKGEARIFPKKNISDEELLNFTVKDIEEKLMDKFFDENLSDARMLVLSRKELNKIKIESVIINEQNSPAFCKAAEKFYAESREVGYKYND